jgi:hypothetical protein
VITATTVPAPPPIPAPVLIAHARHVAALVTALTAERAAAWAELARVAGTRGATFADALAPARRVTLADEGLRAAALALRRSPALAVTRRDETQLVAR